VDAQGFSGSQAGACDQAEQNAVTKPVARDRSEYRLYLFGRNATWQWWFNTHDCAE
jgi:hypothetical protein